MKTSSNREQWKQVLPIIQALVDGKKIQQLGYDKRWKDTDSMYSVLHSIGSYRIKPESIVEGQWSIEYSYTTPGNVSGPVATGILRWGGSNQDNPPWPKDNGYELDFSTEVFVPSTKL